MTDRIISSVADIPDSKLVEFALRSIASNPPKRGGRLLWTAVMETFLLGSTYATQLCVRFGFDPDQRVRR